MEKIRIWRMICLFLLLGICLSSCGGRKPPMDYREDRFSARISWQSSEGVTLMGTLEAEEGELRICLLSPKAWEGVVVSHTQEETRVEYDGMVAEGVALGEIDEVLALLSPRGELRIITRGNWKGRQVLYGEIYQAGEEERYELYLEEKTGIPLEIRRGERSVTFLSFRSGE